MKKMLSLAMLLAVSMAMGDDAGLERGCPCNQPKPKGDVPQTQVDAGAVVKAAAEVQRCAGGCGNKPRPTGRDAQTQIDAADADKNCGCNTCNTCNKPTNTCSSCNRVLEELDTQKHCCCQTNTCNTNNACGCCNKQIDAEDPEARCQCNRPTTNNTNKPGTGRDVQTQIDAAAVVKAAAEPERCAGGCGKPGTNKPGRDVQTQIDASDADKSCCNTGCNTCNTCNKPSTSCGCCNKQIASPEADKSCCNTGCNTCNTCNKPSNSCGCCNK